MREHDIAVLVKRQSILRRNNSEIMVVPIDTHNLLPRDSAVARRIYFCRVVSFFSLLFYV